MQPRTAPEPIGHRPKSLAWQAAIPECGTLRLMLASAVILIASPPAFGEITIQLNVQYGDCGLVTVDGGAWEDGDPITWIDSDWGDGVQFTRQFPAQHRYEFNGSYEVQVTAYGGSGATSTETLTVDIDNAEEPGREPVQIHINLNDPEYLACGEVSINGYVWSEMGQITGMSWDWDDGTTNKSWFPASHGYDQDGSYTVSVTASDSEGGSHTESVVVVITGSESDDCQISLALHPSNVVLRDGMTQQQLRVELRDEENRPVDPALHDLSFESTEPGLAEVSPEGLVSSTGYGEAQVVATLSPSGRTATVTVSAGHLRTRPYLLSLSVSGQSTGAVWADMGNADSSPVDLTGRTVEFLCSGCDPGQPLNIDDTGVIQVVEPYEEDDPMPLSVIAVVDGQWAGNWANVDVSDDDLGLNLLTYEEHNTALVSAEMVSEIDVDEMISSMRVSELFELAFAAQRTLSDGVWFGGSRQVLNHYVSIRRFAGAIPGCGGSGNPIRIGSALDQPFVSCFYTEPQPGVYIPRWGIYFHELGHNITWTDGRFADFADAGDAFSYSEGLATASGMFACEALLRGGEDIGVTPEIADSLEQPGLCWRTGVVGTFLQIYVDTGADYSTLDPNIVDDILWTLIQENPLGHGILYRFFSVFTPRGVGPYPFPMDSTSEQATLFALGMSVATGRDLKARFRDTWGFPIDDTAWDLMLPMVESLVAARDPAANAGDDRTGGTGQVVALDDAFVFDREGDSLTVLWEVVSKPPGSSLVIGDPTSLQTTFSADTPGSYVLGLSAADQWVIGAPDLMTITLEDVGVFTDGFESGDTSAWSSSVP